MSVHPALLTFYIPSTLIIVFCAAIIFQGYCVLSRQSVTLQRRQLRQEEQIDAKLGLLSVASSSDPSSADVERLGSARLSRRRLTALTLMMVLGVLSWGCAAAAAVLERRTPAGTVVACFYALFTSALGLLLFIVHPPASSSPSTSKCSRRIFTRSSCLERLTSCHNFDDRSTAGNTHQQPPAAAVAKQVVYSIANSVPSATHLFISPRFIAEDDLDYIAGADGQEVAVGMRDCTGSSCSVPASVSAAQLPVSVGECEECRFCRSATDGSTDGRSFSRHSMRMKDFDDFTFSSDDEHCDVSLEGAWWNGEVDVDGCSIHRAPCPSPASHCSSQATNNDQGDRSCESRLSPQHPAAASPSPGRDKRRWSVIGASPGTSRKTSRRRRHVDEAEHIGYRRRHKTHRSQTRGSEYIRATSTDRCAQPGVITRQKRRRISTKLRQNYCDT